jgi:hypothetical protein
LNTVPALAKDNIAIGSSTMQHVNLVWRNRII